MTDTSDNSLGTLEQADGRWRLRFVRELPHPPEQVWLAVTGQEGLRAWFPHLVTGAWQPGGELGFVDPEGRGPRFGGEVSLHRPPALLEFSWGEDVLRLEIAPRGDGCTLTFLDTFEELGKAARDAAGWHECLDLLAEHLDGRPASGRPGQRWAELNARYTAALGAEAAVLGPPPGWEPGAPQPPAPQVWPSLRARDARALIRFLVDAFGFEETVVHGDETHVHHAQLSWPPGGGIMLGLARPEDDPEDNWPLRPGTFGAYVVTDDPDALHARAVAAGAEITSGLHNTDYGSRDFAARDPEGNRWSFGTYRGEPRTAG
ncbi:SRPBCC domain-containing protein [Kitasatospora sp. McL0602]|uniref:SRPBCC domain-containing protein n=1 Tax=Kitasatospora sp. McL0602 TaxID=3439530 RepID=UPI003F8BCAEC